MSGTRYGNGLGRRKGFLISFRPLLAVLFFRIFSLPSYYLCAGAEWRFEDKVLLSTVACKKGHCFVEKLFDGLFLVFAKFDYEMVSVSVKIL
jgi:hypothetical protein